jgi:endoglucanase
MTRPSYTCNASCVTGQTAAALAIASIVLNNSTYLSHAKQLFSTADSVKSDEGYTAASGFYSSWSGFYDELMWAGVWLYLATNDSSYLTKAESYIDELNRQGQDDPRIEFTWCQCWDDCHYGAILLLARITDKPEYHEFIQMHLDWWSAGYGSDGKVTTTPGGLAWLDSWGALRYACNAAFIAFVYADMLSDTTLKNRYRGFAERQVDYALGDNPRNASYVCGYGSNPPKRPHHRTSHGSWCDQQTTPPYHRHTLHGALVGGPNSSDGYEDNISDYTMNEVACDYNAAFVGCLARMYNLYGGQALSDFPPPETPEDEFFVEAQVNSAGTDYSEIRAYMNNRSAWPARLIKDLSFTYYVDLSEVFAKGYSVSDLKVSKNGSELATTMSGLTQLSGDTYYIRVIFTDGTDVAPVDQTMFEREVTFRIEAPNASGAWDPSNDYSYQGLASGKVKTEYIPVYDGSTLIFGLEPGAPAPTATPVTTPVPTEAPTEPSTPTPTTVPTTVPTAAPTGVSDPGDVNENGSIDIVDALLVAQYYVGLEPAAFTAPLTAGDVNGNGSVDIVDALLIAQYYVGIIDEFPGF